MTEPHEDAKGVILPPYLQPLNVEAVSSHSDRVTVHDRLVANMPEDRDEPSVGSFVRLVARVWLTDAQLNAP